MIVKIRATHEKTGLFNLTLTAENPEDEKILKQLHQEHLDCGYSHSSDGRGSQLYLNGRAVHE